MPEDAELTLPKPSLAALVISGLFHPLLIPTYFYLLLVGVNPYLFGTTELGESRTMSQLILIFLDTFVIPVVAIFIMLRLNMIKSVMMHKSTERIGPLLLIMILYFWIYYNFHQSGQTPTVFSAFLLGTVIALVVAFVINLIDKISLHATGMGGLSAVCVILLAFFGEDPLRIGTAGVNMVLITAVVFILAGLVGSARLKLGAHDRFQVYTGYAVGFLAQFIALKLYF